jgi:hypothetical protein
MTFVGESTTMTPAAKPVDVDSSLALREGPEGDNALSSNSDAIDCMMDVPRHQSD